MGEHSGWPYPTGDPLPSEQEMRSQAEEIAARRARGESISAIARDLGIDRGTVYARLKMLVEGPKPPAKRGPRKEVVGYQGAHVRLRLTQGRAAEHDCHRCGEPADEWSYNHADPNELIDEDLGLPYSLSSDHYVPMCKSCHVRFDATARR